jgi:hypothetical protein
MTEDADIGFNVYYMKGKEKKKCLVLANPKLTRGTKTLRRMSPITSFKVERATLSFTDTLLDTEMNETRHQHEMFCDSTVAHWAPSK